MVISDIFGTLAMFASMGISCVALPTQVLKNRKQESVEGISPVMPIAIMFSYCMWFLYGLTKPDWFLITAQTPGVLFSTILVFQQWKYRKKAENA